MKTGNVAASETDFFSTQRPVTSYNTVSTVSTEDMPGVNYAQATATNTATCKAFRACLSRRVPPPPPQGISGGSTTTLLSRPTSMSRFSSLLPSTAQHDDGSGLADDLGTALLAGSGSEDTAREERQQPDRMRSRRGEGGERVCTRRRRRRSRPSVARRFLRGRWHSSARAALLAERGGGGRDGSAGVCVYFGEARDGAREADAARPPRAGRGGGGARRGKGAARLAKEGGGEQTLLLPPLFPFFLSFAQAASLPYPAPSA